MLNRLGFTLLATNLVTPSAYFVLNCGLLATERLDPIVSPGQIAQHVHSVAGASNFGPTITYESLLNSSCTTCNTQADKSSYWAPTLYHQAPNGVLSPYRLGNTRVYYKYSIFEDVKPFPKGLQVISGDPARKTFNSSAADNQAIRFMCLGSVGEAAGESTVFPDKACPGGIQLQIWFPACWDGKSTTAPDHKSHMAFTVEGYNGDRCPSSHPVKVPQLMLEFIFMTGEKEYHGPRTYVLANGDTTGYGLHADFVSGWDDAPDSPLAQALKTCGADSTWGEVYGCAPLRKSADLTAQSGCSIDPIVQEDVGLVSSIKSLPGCNSLWSSGPKPPCDLSVQASTLLASAVSSSPSNVLPSFTSSMSGSVQSTPSILDTPIESTLSMWDPAGPLPTVTPSQPQLTTIPPDIQEFASTVTITSIIMVPAPCTSEVSRPSATATGPAATSPWVSLGCVSLRENIPILIATVISDYTNMTVENCQQHCRGFALAGLLQGSICTCGNNFANSIRNTIDSSQCSSQCSGDEATNCGGDWSISLFQRPLS